MRGHLNWHSNWNIILAIKHVIFEPNLICSAKNDHKMSENFILLYVKNSMVYKQLKINKIDADLDMLPFYQF